jgi:hypothetical protein
MQRLIFLVVATFLFTVVSMTIAPVDLFASSDEDDVANEDETREDSRDEDDSGTEASDDGDNGRDDNSDDNVAFTSHAESTINDEQREVRDVKSNEESKESAAKISHELTHTVQSGGATSDPAHEGTITLADKDGEVLKKITTESAPQSSAAFETEILTMDLTGDVPG